MSAHGQFNTKNPTIKRILKEASELSTVPSADLHAEPTEENLFEWHFTVRGPPAPSPYAGGLYHGRIILPPQYPLRPPSFRFLTPTGRFEVNREICLSISGHHEETWQPAWGVRTALVAIRSFMDTEAQGQLGGIECSKDARVRMAKESGAWTCVGCGKSNADIMKEREALLAETEDSTHNDDQVPEELRLAYRDELAGKGSRSDSNADKGKGNATESPSQSASSSTPSIVQPESESAPRIPPAVANLPPPTRQAQHMVRRSPDRSIVWIDTCIYGVAVALLFMLVKKLG